jgi:hypothetical protein
VNTLGIDLSSRFIDLVLLDENSDRAEWTRIVLEGATAFERAREVAEWMPQPGWYEAHGVYLIALERPFVRRGQDVIRLIQGCVLAELPRALEVWEVSPSQWKNALGVPMRDKPTSLTFPEFGADHGELAYWPTDALDALGVALYARDTNAALVARALGGAA